MIEICCLIFLERISIISKSHNSLSIWFYRFLGKLNFFYTHTIDNGWQEGGGYSHADQGARGALEQGHGHSSARC